MGEEWVLKAIKHGSITVNDNEYSIVKSKDGSCIGCDFRVNGCNSKTRAICCTGGNILVKVEQNK